MDAVLGVLDAVLGAANRPRLVEKKRMRNAGGDLRVSVAARAREGSAERETFPNPKAGAGIEQDPRLHRVLDVDRFSLLILAEAEMIGDIARRLLDSAADADEYAARPSCRAASLGQCRCRNHERCGSQDRGSQRGPHQLTPTAVQACVTARSAALLFP